MKSRSPKRDKTPNYQLVPTYPPMSTTPTGTSRGTKKEKLIIKDKLPVFPKKEKKTPVNKRVSAALLLDQDIDQKLVQDFKRVISAKNSDLL